MSTKVLADKDVNAAMTEQHAPVKEVKSMEYHRQMLQTKMAQEETYGTLISLLKTATNFRQDDPVCLALGQHHEPLHRQDQRSAQQAREQVRIPSPQLCRTRLTIHLQGQTQVAVRPSQR